jgi:DNA modification methylase
MTKKAMVATEQIAVERPQSPFTQTGYTPDHDLSIEEWSADGDVLMHMHKTLQWCLGDWLHYYVTSNWEAEYGDLYAEAEEKTGLSNATLRNYKYVASKIGRDLREKLSSQEDKLGFAHFLQVCSYTPEEQEYLLLKALHNGWSVKGFRELIPSLLEEFHLPETMQLLHGDFYEQALLLEAGSVQLILTDPPYNVANDREFALDGRKNISQDFGEWDRMDDEEYRGCFDSWAEIWERILCEDGSGYVFVPDKHISYLMDALENAGLHVKTMIVWHKTNPGTQVMHTTFKSSNEYVLFFTKGGGGHTFHWGEENEMQNHIEMGICQGHERILDTDRNILHTTQKPVALLQHFMLISSNPGDVVFDGFAGVGSTGRAALDNQRCFIGIEQNEAYFVAMRKRLAS